MHFDLRIYDKQFLKSVEKVSRENVNKATDYFWRRCREQVNKKWPPASKPGQPPRKRTGRGRDSIEKRVGIIGTPTGYVGIPKKAKGYYMQFLDEGTNLVAARPWLSATYTKYADRITHILLTGRPR
jgi:hypothetical protein